MEYINLVVEDSIQETTARKVLTRYAPQITVGKALGGRGAGYIDNRIEQFIRSAGPIPFIVFRDLDQLECAPLLSRLLLPRGSSDRLLLCIAVREVEAWLIADRDNLKTYLGVSKLESGAESILNPKEYLIKIARRSRRKSIRDGLVPTGSAVRGKLYNAILLQFVINHWDTEKARRGSSSLERFIRKVGEFSNLP